MTAKRSTIQGYLLIAGLLVISIIVWHRVYQMYAAQRSKTPAYDGLTVTFLDVWQGDSILITTPNKKNILIDGGSIPGEWSKFNAGEQVVLPYLRSRGIRKLDLVVGTHPHLDHIGGLIPVLKKIRTNLFLDSGTISTIRTYENLLKTIKKRRIKYEIARRGELQIDPSITFEVLSPVTEAFINSPNNNSIVIKLTYGNISFLFTGDIEELSEELYAEIYKDTLNSTILKVGHHGGGASATNIFLNYVAPEIAIISCGQNNPFGHPSKHTLKRLSDANANIYRTDVHGTITVTTDGSTYTVTTTSGPATPLMAGQADKPAN